MPSKSAFRQPSAKHFQLVHRSQRDPLIHDPDASQHVLKAVERPNAKKGKSRAELDDDSSEQACDASEDRIGQAALYGIFYDDSEYDYMQHLRQVGVQEEGVESILIEAPGPKRSKRKNSTEFLSTEIPREALPSASELPRTYESQEAIPSSIAGLQPDMDPHLRQVLQALEDDAFVDEGLEEDFFGELLADGTRGDGEEFLYEFNEDGEEADAKGSFTMDDERDESWEARFARFKIEQKQIKAVVGSDADALSEGGDTVGRLPALSVIGGKRRRKGTSDASGYSMSSSSMFRNDALQTLDARFDQIMEKEYDSETDGNDREASEHSDGSAAPELITSRDDFGALMDDFLDNYEMLGRKMKPKLKGETGVEKLNTIRRALGPAHLVSPGVRDSDETEEESLAEEDREKDRWDCETILTTYSNLENHPRLIRARDPLAVSKIRLDPKTGFPFTTQVAPPKPRPARTHSAVYALQEDERDVPLARFTVSRPRDESKEEKKQRKQTVKAERQARRTIKKATKEQFGAEAQHQMKGIANKEKKLQKL